MQYNTKDIYLQRAKADGTFEEAPLTATPSSAVMFDAGDNLTTTRLSELTVGTSSIALSAVSASFALSASVVYTTALTTSFASSSMSSSWASSSLYSEHSLSSSYASGSDSASYALNSTYNETSSYANTINTNNVFIPYPATNILSGRTFDSNGDLYIYPTNGYSYYFIPLDDFVSGAIPFGVIFVSDGSPLYMMNSTGSVSVQSIMWEFAPDKTYAAVDIWNNIKIADDKAAVALTHSISSSHSNTASFASYTQLELNGGKIIGSLTNGISDCLAYGTGSHAEGKGTFAGGDTSHAEGYSSQAKGESSHAEGLGNVASASYSHAEGFNSFAYGESSHVEGSSNVTNGNSSHAEGEGCSANGYGSHVEGSGCVTNEEGSHAEGASTQANGGYSHAEGASTQANGNSSHAEGNGTQASGSYSHSEGEASIAYGYGSHTEGLSTFAYGEFSHAEGSGCVANGEGSHAEGGSCVANGEGSHAEGSSTQANGKFSHSEGNNTIAVGDYQMVVGQFNNPNSSSFFIVGGGNGVGPTLKNQFEVNTSGSILSGSLSVEISVKLSPTSQPSNPVAGQIYFDSGNSHFYGYNGITWKQLDN